RSSGLSGRGGLLRLVDFGAGKGYLTFALHDYLQAMPDVTVQTTGIELRGELVKSCNDTVAALDIEGLAFRQGDIGSYRGGTGGSNGDGGSGGTSGEASFDVMIALHACDTATDDAIHQGIRAGAAIIMCAPCCHKQLRPQLLSPHPLRPILQHGIHLGQEAEMLTDGLRALLLDASGYDTQVFEFISLEHTSKNKMILAVKRSVPREAGPVLAQIGEIKAFYGIREQRLESLLLADGLLADIK
nr:SAM-dependent methyltransferase [Lautropia sp.]